jgi:hypothetical protein
MKGVQTSKKYPSTLAIKINPVSLSSPSHHSVSHLNSRETDYNFSVYTKISFCPLTHLKHFWGKKQFIRLL